MKSKGYGLVCPHCGAQDHGVCDSRPSGDMIRRRRRCADCGRRFTTWELAWDEVGETGEGRPLQLLETIRVGGEFLSLPKRQQKIVRLLIAELAAAATAAEVAADAVDLVAAIQSTDATQ